MPPLQKGYTNLTKKTEAEKWEGQTRTISESRDTTPAAVGTSRNASRGIRRGLELNVELCCASYLRDGEPHAAAAHCQLLIPYLRL